MANDLTISLGVELNEGDLNGIKSKIDALTNSKGNGNKISLDLNKTINTQISQLEKQLSTIEGKQYKISFQIDPNILNQINNLTNQLQNISGSGKGNRGSVGNGRSKQSGKVQGASFPVSRRKWAQRYRDTAEAEVQQYIKSLTDKGATAASSSISAKYDKTGKAIAYEAIVNYKNELGKQIQTVLTKDLTDKNKIWKVGKTTVNTNYLAQSQQADYNSKYLSNQLNKVADLESKAFKQNNPLTGTFKDEADKAIKYWRDQVTKAQSYSQKLTVDQENELRKSESDARRIVLEQQKAQWRGDKLAAKDVGSKVSNARWGLDIQAEELKQTGQYTDETKQKIEDLKTALNSVNDQQGFDQWSQQLKDFNNELKLTSEQAKTAFKNDAMQLDLENLQNRLTNIKQKYDEFIKDNPGKADSGIEATFKNIADQIAQIDMDHIDPNKLKLIGKEIRNLSTEVNGVVTPAQSLGQILRDNFGEVGSYLARFVSVTAVIGKTVSTIKKMVNEVTELDTSLMEIQKVTTLSGDSLEQFTDKAYKVGEGLGRTGKDVIDAVTTFSRAGYDLNESTELAKAALTMTNVGVDIPNTAAAASDMISILRAYDKQANESMQVIDELYNVANKEPLDFGNITDMLVTAGGTLSQAGNSLEETMGLLTGGFATLRDNSVANGLLQISQRLRAVKEDGSDMESSFLPKLKKAFGDVGVAIEDENGELRSTFDILQDLAGRWDDLDSKQRQYLGEKAAGNRQVKVLNAIMANWDVVEDTIQNANEATGAATEGNEKYLDSIQGRITEFQSAFQNLSRTTIDSGFVKGLVSIGTSIVNITTKAGGLVPVLTTIGGFITMFKGAKITEGLAKAVPQLAKAFGILKSGEGVLKSLGALFSTPVGMVGGILAAVGIIASIAHAVSEAHVSAQEKLDNANQNYSNEQSKLDSLNSELENTKQLMTELEGKGKLTVVEQDQYESLKRTNDELERQKKIQEERVRIAQKGVMEAAVTSYRQMSKGVVNDYIDVRPHLYEEYVKAQAEVDRLYANGVDIESDEFKSAEKNRDNWQRYIDESNNAINDAIGDLDEIIGDNLRIENPQNEIEKAFNAIFDYREQLYNALLSGPETLKSEQSNYILDKFKEQEKELQNYIQESGELTQEYLEENYSNLVDAFKEKGWEIEEIVQHLNEILGQVGNEDTASMLRKNLDSLFESNFFGTDFYKNLSTAISEQEKAGQVSIDTYRKLMEDADFSKYIENTANALKLTGDGFAFNTEAINDYIKAQAEAQKSEAMYAWGERLEKLKQLKEAQQDLAKYSDEYRDNIDQQRAIESEIGAIQAYIQELDSATGALNRYKAAKSSANEDVDFLSGQGAYKDIVEGRKTGKIGTDDFQSAVDYVLGDNWRENLSEFDGSVEKAYKTAEEKAKRYLGQKDEYTGGMNFLKDVERNGYGAFDKDGNFTLNTIGPDGKEISIANIAKDMKVSEDLVKSMFKMLNTYADVGDGFFFPELFDEERYSNAKKELESLDTTYNQLGNTIEDNEKKIAEAEAAGDEKTASDLKKQNNELKEAQSVIGEERDAVSSGQSIEAEINTMSLEDALAKIEQLGKVVETLNGSGIDVPVRVDEMLNTLTEQIPKLREESQQPIITNFQLGGSGADEIVQVKNDVDSIPENKPIEISMPNLGDAQGKVADLVKPEPKTIDVNVQPDDASLSAIDSAIQEIAEKPRIVTFQYKEGEPGPLQPPTGDQPRKDYRGEVPDSPQPSQGVIPELTYKAKAELDESSIANAETAFEDAWASDEVEVDAELNGDGLAEEAQNALENGDYEIKPEVKPETTPSPTPTPQATPAPTSQQTSQSPLTQTVTLEYDASAIDSYSVPDKSGTAEYDVDASSVNSWTPPQKRGTVVYSATGFAEGTKNAPKGTSLVDEEGAELIEHTRRGTFELGTNKGARFTQLDKGDVVHTAKETKTILSRMARVGGFFRDGLNQAKSIIGGAFATGVTGGLAKNTYKKLSTTTKSSSANKSSGSKNGKLNDKKFSQWVEKLFDWAEVRLNRLQTITNNWLINAAEAIGYIAKNNELSNAISSVEDQINDTAAAYDLYIEQARVVAEKAGLAEDIVQKIHDGNIEIAEYDKTVQDKIKQYQTW